MASVLSPSNQAAVGGGAHLKQAASLFDKCKFVGKPIERAKVVDSGADEHQTLPTFLANIPDNQFYIAPPGVWTPAEKERILAKWQQKGAEFVEVIEQWSEEDLDHYILPHPLLGNLTIREMLLFTIYHNMHHANDVQALLNQAQVEWFKAQTV